MVLEFERMMSWKGQGKLGAGESSGNGKAQILLVVAG